MMEFTSHILLLFFFIALIAATVDAVAGGGGLLTLPFLLLLGLPPTIAIATNKVGATAGSFSAALHFFQQGKISWQKDNLWGFAFTFFGSAVGAMVLMSMTPSKLVKTMPILLVMVALYFILSPHIGKQSKANCISRQMFVGLICPLLGFYDGFFGPGAGTFMAIALVTFLGFNLASATAHAKLLNFASNSASLLYFILFGKIYWALGLAMLFGQLIGGHIGAHLVIKHGQQLIRTIMVVVSISISIKLLFF